MGRRRSASATTTSPARWTTISASLSGDNAYKKATGRLGLTWNPVSDFGLYASWGTGFLPARHGGAGQQSQRLRRVQQGPQAGHLDRRGDRSPGLLGGALAYDVALFHLATDNDFGRFRISSPPLETFYGNVGSTTRYGLETSLAWYPIEPLALRAGLHLQPFQVRHRPDARRVGRLRGNLAAQFARSTSSISTPNYKITPALTAGAALEYVSSWYIDSTNRVYLFDPELYPNVSLRQDRSLHPRPCPARLHRLGARRAGKNHRKIPRHRAGAGGGATHRASGRREENPAGRARPPADGDAGRGEKHRAARFHAGFDSRRDRSREAGGGLRETSGAASARHRGARETGHPLRRPLPAAGPGDASNSRSSSTSRTSRPSTWRTG